MSAVVEIAGRDLMSDCVLEETLRRMKGGWKMTKKEKQCLKELVWRSLGNDDSWQIVSRGSAREITALAGKLGINEPITHAVAEEFVQRREGYLRGLEEVIEKEAKNDFEQAVDLFRKGIRVMDHADPTYYGITGRDD